MANFPLDYVFLDHEVKSVIAEEKARVDAKETHINDVYFLKKRKEFLLGSQTARMLAVLKMWIVTFVLVAFSLAMFNLRKVFPFFSELAVVVFTLSVLSLGLIYLFVLYTDYAKRDKVDYNKIDFSLLQNIKPEIETDLKDETSLYDLIKRDPSTCVGLDCCPANTSLVDNVCTKN